MLPLSLLNAAQNKPMLVELKNGSTFNGHLVACDNFMNLTLREVYETSAVSVLAAHSCALADMKGSHVLTTSLVLSALGVVERRAILEAEGVLHSR